MERLDNYLKNKSFFDSREKAQKAIKSSAVIVNGKIINKVSYMCNDQDEISIIGEPNKFVSRGGYKLEKAVDVFNINIEGQKAVDIGSSTGGFSDLLLQRNIGSIVCVDVGKGQLNESIRSNKKVRVFEETDFRKMNESEIADADIIVIDVSFISVKLLIEKINKVYNKIRIICLVKPQFECGAQIAKKYKGVIKDKNIHFNVLTDVIGEWKKSNFCINNLTYSPITGGDGNIEYLLLISRDETFFHCDVKKVINEAFQSLSANSPTA